MPGRKKPPVAGLTLPAARAFAPSDAGHFAGMTKGSQSIRGGANQFVHMMWSSGEGDKFQYGKAVARLARIHGKEGDYYGAHRPDMEILFMEGGAWLHQFKGFEELPDKLKEVLLDNTDVMVETNDGVSVNAESALESGVQVIPLIPDAEGNFDVDKAREIIAPQWGTA